jgi:hypothetical protein
MEPGVTTHTGEMPVSHITKSRQYGQARQCVAPGCETTLSRYNPGECCSVHEAVEKRRDFRSAPTRQAEPIVEDEEL